MSLREFISSSVLILCLSPAVSIAGPSSDDSDSADTGFLAKAELGIFSGTVDTVAADVDVTVLTPRFELGYTSGKLGVVAVLPLTNASLSVDPADASSFRVGNPMLKGVFDLDLGLLEVEASAGFTIPVASIPDLEGNLSNADDVLAAQTALTYAQAMSGYNEFWLYQRDTVSVVGELKAEVDLIFIQVRGDAAIAAMFSTSDNANESIPVRLGGDVLFTLIPFTSVGVRLQTVFFPLEDGAPDADQFQFTVAPLVELRLRPITIEGKFFINVDDPAGFSFDDNRVWGAFVSVGIEI